MSENKFIAMKSAEGGFINMKFRVSSPEQSSALQEKLFEMGYKWISGHTTAQHIRMPFIYAVDGDLSWDDCDVKFSDDPSQEIDTQSFIDGTYEKERPENAPKQEPTMREKLQQKVIEAWEHRVQCAAATGDHCMLVLPSTPKFIMDHLVNVLGLAYDGDYIRWD